MKGETASVRGRKYLFLPIRQSNPLWKTRYDFDLRLRSLPGRNLLGSNLPVKEMAAAPQTHRSVAGHPHGRVPRAVREQQLLDVAKELFARKGYQGTSIEDIARGAGVTRPIVYDHFDSKDSLYLACVRGARNELERMFTEAAGATQD